MTETAEPESIHDVLADARHILDAVDGAFVESMKLSPGTISVEPMRLAQGEDIAHALGLVPGVEHASTIPPVTVWGGKHGHREIYVRGTRPRTGTPA